MNNTKTFDMIIAQMKQAKTMLNKDVETLQRQIQELYAAKNSLDKNKKKLQLELENSTIGFEARSAKILELSFKLSICENAAQERDAAVKDAREKDAKVLVLTRELDDAHSKIHDLESKLNELANTQVRTNIFM
jgi:myosin protein heavy chain